MVGYECSRRMRFFSATVKVHYSPKRYQGVENYQKKIVVWVWNVNLIVSFETFDRRLGMVMQVQSSGQRSRIEIKS